MWKEEQLASRKQHIQWDTCEMWIVCFNWFTFSMILAFCSSHLLFTIQFKLWQNRFNINCAQPSSILREAQKIWLAPFASSHTRLVCKMLLWILAQQTFCIHNSVEFYSRIIRNTISLAPVLFHQFRKYFTISILRMNALWLYERREESGPVSCDLKVTHI